jgi:type IV pilus assembly protein PilM
MALLGKPNAYLGLDIGTSSLKMVELLSRYRRLEVATYAEANIQNPLIAPTASPDTAVREVANVIGQMMERAGVATDSAIAALPSSIVFSTVLMLPNLPEKKMDEAVHFAARDVVPADLDDMFLGWSRVGDTPHMDGEKETTADSAATPKEAAAPADTQKIPVFITAAPRDVVERYQQVMDSVGLELVALEVETFPLVRSLLVNEYDSGMIVDIGDQATAFHLIDKGTARISHTTDFGGSNITAAIAAAAKLDFPAAHQAKITHGILPSAPIEVRTAALEACEKIMNEAQRLLALYARQAHADPITKTVLIGGGAKLPGLLEVWGTKSQNKVQIGNPWRGLSYPDELQSRMTQLGPNYSVAVGLAQRGFNNVV